VVLSKTQQSGCTRGMERFKGRNKKKPAANKKASLSCPFCGGEFEDVTEHLDQCPGTPSSQRVPSSNQPRQPTQEPTPPPKIESQTPPRVSEPEPPKPSPPIASTPPAPPVKVEPKPAPPPKTPAPEPPIKLAPPEPPSKPVPTPPEPSNKPVSESNIPAIEVTNPPASSTFVKANTWKPTTSPMSSTRKNLLDRTADPAPTKSESLRPSSGPQEFAVCLYSFPKQNDNEIELEEGDRVQVLEFSTPEWIYVRKGTQEGFVAADYLVLESQIPENSESGEAESDIEVSPQSESVSGTAPESGAPAIRPSPSKGSGITPNFPSNPGKKPVKPAAGGGALATLRSFTTKKKRKSGEFVISRSETTVPVYNAKPSDTFEISRADSSPDSVTPVETAPPEPKENVDQRTKIAREILQTEKHYITVLKALTERYKGTLLYQIDIFNGHVTKEAINEIFSNLEMILPINEQLFSDLSKIIEGDWNDNSSLGDTFVRVAPFLKMYNQYSNRYDHALATLARCSKNESFSQLVEEIDGTTKLGARLEALLIAPIQRIPRYTLLLQELKRYTPESHPDQAHLARAIPLMQEVGDYINRDMLQSENQAKLLELSMQGAQSLLKPHRVLLHESTTWSEAANKRKMHAWIFNDILVLLPDAKAKNRTQLTNPKFQWPLHLVWVGEKSKKYKNTFTLIGPTRNYLITCLAEELDTWINHIHHSVQQHLEYLSVTQDTELQTEKEAKMTLDNPKRYGTYQFPTSETYSGWWLSGKFEGIGKFSFFGNVYEGAYRDHMKEGKGVMKFVSGEVYDGEWLKDKQQGKGTITYPNGDVYTGNWVEGRKQGKGELKCKNGDSYIGEWFDDVPQGLGEMYYNNGLVYNGNWENGLRHHYGILIYPSGERYEGEWVQSVQNGKGRMEYFPGCFYDGYWKDGLYQGQGKYVSANGTYDGEWVAGQKEGQGSMVYPNQKIYKGGWKRNLYHGHGVITYPCGLVHSYSGEWQLHKKHGSGTLLFFNGDSYEGHFKDNMLHGTGTFTWANGTQIKGKWTRNRITGECIYSKPKGADKKEKETYQGVYKEGKLVGSDLPPVYIAAFPPVEIDIM